MSGLENSRKVWLSIWKWIILLIVAGAVFYTVHPKYYFKLGGNNVRANTITGKVEIIDQDKSGKYAWVDLIELDNRE